MVGLEERAGFLIILNGEKLIVRIVRAEVG